VGGARWGNASWKSASGWRVGGGGVFCCGGGIVWVEGREGAVAGFALGDVSEASDDDHQAIVIYVLLRNRWGILSLLDFDRKTKIGVGASNVGCIWVSYSFVATEISAVETARETRHGKTCSESGSCRAQWELGRSCIVRTGLRHARACIQVLHFCLAAIVEQPLLLR
jgi:hypothetical protein